ncbi:hypothetical protein [Nocardia niwae]|uniref:hypothetical protein n=1 Tax=Nocardia niwae TaxID=626084 RepID=UPI0012F50A4E|nr:hypothetical protein [Nocardia niwae]
MEITVIYVTFFQNRRLGRYFFFKLHPQPLNMRQKIGSRMKPLPQMPSVGELVMPPRLKLRSAELNRYQLIVRHLGKTRAQVPCGTNLDVHAEPQIVDDGPAIRVFQQLLVPHPPMPRLASNIPATIRRTAHGITVSGQPQSARTAAFRAPAIEASSICRHDCRHFLLDYRLARLKRLRSKIEVPYSDAPMVNAKAHVRHDRIRSFGFTPWLTAKRELIQLCGISRGTARIEEYRI